MRLRGIKDKDFEQRQARPLVFAYRSDHFVVRTPHEIEARGRAYCWLICWLICCLEACRNGPKLAAYTRGTQADF